MVENLEALLDALEMVEQDIARKNADKALRETLAHLDWYSRTRTLDFLACMHGGEG